MTFPSYQFEGMTMAIRDMDAMLKFYREVFNISFTEKWQLDHSLYAGKWGPFHLLFCPAKLAKNKARQNRHQFDIIVENIDYTLGKVASHGGSIISGLDEDELSFICDIYDPDHNSIVLKQYK